MRPSPSSIHTPHDILIVEDREETSQRLKGLIDRADHLKVSGVVHTVDAGINALFTKKHRFGPARWVRH